MSGLDPVWVLVPSGPPIWMRARALKCNRCLFELDAVGKWDLALFAL